MNEQYNYPRIQPDLIYVLDAENDTYIIKEPKLARFFRFSVPVVGVARLLDGTRSVAAVSEQTGLGEAMVQQVVNKLAQAYLLDVGLSEADTRQALQDKRELSRPKIDPGRLLLLYREIVNPDSWIETMYHRLHLKYLFQPWFAGLLLLVYFIAYLVYAEQAELMGNALAQLWRPDVVWLYWPVWGITATLHELAHGFACKHYGGKVHAMGVGLYYFQPLFYCDVTDAWLFPQRRQRIVTHGAGLLMNLLIASLAVFLLPFLTANPLLTVIAAWLFVISGVKSLFSLNPLIRLDGYFLLADLLGIDNLRTRAFGTLFIRVRHFLYRHRLLKQSPPPLPRPRSKNERWALLPYAVLSLFYIIGIMGFLGYRGGQWLATYVGLWGWLAAFLLAGIFLISPLWQGWRASGDSRDTATPHIV